MHAGREDMTDSAFQTIAHAYPNICKGTHMTTRQAHAAMSARYASNHP